MKQLWYQMKRLWNGCKKYTYPLAVKTVQGTGTVAKGVFTTFHFIASILMFFVLVSGLILAAAGISFFNVPIVKQIQYQQAGAV